MKLSFTAIILCISIVIFSVLVANVANLINADNHYDDIKLSGPINLQYERWLKDKQQTSDTIRMDDKPNHLMWFIQISDLHISIFQDENRVKNLREFTTRTLSTIKPSVVLASGDLTDAKDRDHLGSRQYEREWQIYYDVLESSHVRNKTLWMDIRGNHDNFNVPSDASENNFFRTYSMQGKEHKRSYMKQIRGNGGELYTFIAVDACLEPGPKRPFNFVGILSKNDMDHIEHLVEESRANGGNYTVWFGHYPTSCIVSMNAGKWNLRRLIGQYSEGIVYMCGHLHTLGGLVPHMYSMQKDGFLELELADWKHTRAYRLAAFDHGIFSFIDATHNSWPLILVTNPKHAMFRIPDKENPNVSLKSTHIRILAFSPDGITNCSVSINYQPVIYCTKASDNLFVVKWDPNLYKTGSHVITVRVIDGVGRDAEVTQPFVLGTQDGPTFDFLARLVIMGDASTLFIYLFAFALGVCVVPLSFFRIWHCLAVAGKVKAPRIPCRGKAMPVSQKLWVLSSVNRLFWPIIGYGIYLAIGPWSIGEVIDGHMGVIFVWGIYVNGAFLPGSLTYLYGFLQILLCQLPLMFIYANCVETRYYHSIGMPTKYHRVPLCSLRKLANAPFYLIMTVEVILAIFFWNAYGTMAFIIGPFRTWSVVLNASLWYLARNVPDKSLRSAAHIWNPKEKLSNGDDTSHQHSSEL